MDTDSNESMSRRVERLEEQVSEQGCSLRRLDHKLAGQESKGSGSERAVGAETGQRREPPGITQSESGGMGKSVETGERPETPAGSSFCGAGSGG